MKISKRVADLLEAQIGHELQASQDYLAMAVYFGHEGLDAWGDFFYRQSEEERGHAMKIVRFLVDVGHEFKISAVREGDPSSVKSPADAAQTALNHESKVTEQFQAMHRVANEDHDGVSIQFLAWFLNEQIEEEASMDKLVRILKSGLNPFQAEPLLQRIAAEA